ncbi:hypothetical protein LguiA_004359 [Lonicera macranthoides]
MFAYSGVLNSALDYFRTSSPEVREERAMMLEEWLKLVSSFGELGGVSAVRVELPKKLKRRRLIETEDGPLAYAHQLCNRVEELGGVAIASP